MNYKTVILLASAVYVVLDYTYCAVAEACDKRRGRHNAVIVLVDKTHEALMANDDYKTADTDSRIIAMKEVIEPMLRNFLGEHVPASEHDYYRSMVMRRIPHTCTKD